MPSFSIIANPTPAAAMPALPSSVVGIPAPWIMQQMISGIPNWILIGVPLALFFYLGRARRRR